MLKNQKGFTLVELLAVIVILAIILAIAIPAITGLIRNMSENAFESSVKMLIKGVDYKVLEGEITTANMGTFTDVTLFGGSASDFSSFAITSLEPITINVTGTAGGKFEGYSATGATFTNPNISTP